MNNYWHWASSVKNSGMIRLLVTFQAILGCVVFNLISTLSDSDYTWSFVRIRSIENRFVVVISQILNKYLETLKNLNIRRHSLVFMTLGCVTNVNTNNYRKKYSVSIQWYVQIYHGITFLPIEGRFLSMELHP